MTLLTDSAARMADMVLTARSRFAGPLCAEVVLSLVCLANPVVSRAADNAADALDSEAGDAVTDVVVTARRREERAQDVPIAVSVLSSSALDSTGTVDIGGVAQLQPTVQFYSSNPRNSAITIRGLGSPFGLTNDGIEPGVGIYVDQVYYARSASSTFDFLDVDQIEVLRGAQGTLYGKNTTAGAINVTSRKPSFTPEAQAEVSLGNYDYVQTKESLSGALIGNTLAGRIGTSYTTRNGTIYNVTTGKDINGEYNVGVKTQLLLHATDSLDMTLYADYSYQNPVCCGQIYAYTSSTQRALARQYAALAVASGNYAPPSFNAFDRVTDLDANMRATQRFGGTSLLTEWTVGPGVLTSVTAWRYWGWLPANDRDFTGLPITTVSQNPSMQRQLSQEIRYEGTSGPIDYVAGLFGFHQTVATSGVQQQGSLASLWLLSGASANDPTLLNGLTSYNNIGLKNTSAAAFGQLTWHVTDSLRLQPGLRFNEDYKSGYYIATVVNGTHTALTSAQAGVLAPQSYAPSFNNHNVSGDFTASYDVAKNILGYVTYAHSYQPGGINMSGLPLNANNQPILEDQTVAPEKVNDYELGLKTQWLDRRLTVNVDAFWTDIKDFQTTVTNSQQNVIRGYLANAGKVRSRGFELDSAARPFEQLSVYFNGAFTDARYINFANAPCPPELSGGTTASAAHPASAPGTPGGYSPSFCDISGQWLPGISRIALSYGGEYHLPLNVFNHATQAYVGFDGNYRSKFSSNPSRSTYTDIPAYAIGNFRAGIRTSSGWDIYGWVRNAFNRDYYQFLATQSGSTGLVVGQPGDPLTYGFTFRLSL